jgi:uncharacterized membrane protein (DUF373 family)
MRSVLKKIETAIILALIAMMSAVVVLATIELGWILIKDVVTPPVFLLEIDNLLEIFGFFLLVLIGVELLETVRMYLDEHVVHAEIVIQVAVIAIARKIVILEVKDLSGSTLAGVAGIIAALAAAYYVVRPRERARVGDSTGPATPGTSK